MIKLEERTLKVVIPPQAPCKNCGHWVHEQVQTHFGYHPRFAMGSCIYGWFTPTDAYACECDDYESVGGA